MSSMFDDFENDEHLDTEKFINQTSQSRGHDVNDEVQSKAISKTITINGATLKLVDDMQKESRVDFSQMVRAGILALKQMDRAQRELLFDASYVPRNAGRKKKK
ncbi:hypothetical protein [Photobacterium indicum]|uniref:hypothetical protein n=1 Tax=Photobacterium indicum TaxID=81447 RepID=UPI003D0BE9FD